MDEINQSFGDMKLLEMVDFFNKEISFEEEDEGAHIGEVRGLTGISVSITICSAMIRK